MTFSGTVLPRADATEQALRVDLAAAYRLIARFGMDDTIYTHLTVRLPGRETRFLMNPYGLMFDEITASSLVTLDLDGRRLDNGAGEVNDAGFTIHSAVYGGRADVNCVIHTHTQAGMAVAAMKEGLLPLNQISFEFYNRIAYHDYEGLALDLDERARIVADLGLHDAMILRNHGLLTVGRTVAEAFYYIYYLEQACRIQMNTLRTGAELVMPPPEICEHAARQSQQEPQRKGRRLWQALVRRLDREERDYRD
jgi:ribulose-5-phosphate 4-epimerase/fuculose-1-phosphate aldolase